MKVDKTTGQVTIKDGTEVLGNVFTSDPNGGGSWLPVISSFASVNASAANQFIPPSTPTIIGFSTVVFDRGGDFSTVTNEYTAPESGIYSIKGYTVFGQINANNQVWLLLYKNGNPSESLYLNGQVLANTATYALGSTMQYLNAGDKMQLRVESNEGIFISGSNIQVAKLSN